MNTEENIKMHKAVKHANYDHTMAVFMGKKRYVKEEKKYRNKSSRKKAKQNLRGEY